MGFGSARTVAGVCALLLGVPAVPASAVESYDEVVEIVFPTDPAVARFSNDYDAARGGGSRVHMATDIIVPKHTPVYATVDGEVCYITGIDEPEPSWGYHLKICGDDGIEYDYIHINNDTPGTDDGMGGPEHAYAPGIRRGVRVAAGQLVGWAGDSGNAENTVSHVHFEMESSDVSSPYGTPRMNPYPSLMAAIAEGRISDGTAVVTDPKGRVAGADRVATALAVADEGYRRARTVVLARSDQAWPAIVGGPLAAVHDGPVLTTAPDALDDRVRERIDALGAARVYLVGAVEFDLAEALAGLDVTELVLIDGGDRYATSAMVAELVWEATGAPARGSEDTDVASEDAPEDVATDGGIDGDAVDFPGDLNELEDRLIGLAEGWLEPRDLPDAELEAIQTLADRGPSLVVADNRERRDAVYLDGAVVSADFVVQLIGVDPTQVSTVDFWFDAEPDERRRDRRERFAPYDATDSTESGPILFEVAEWGAGRHTITVAITDLDDRVDVLEVDFEIAGVGVHPTVESRDAILALGDHENPNRSWPDALMASYYGSARWIPVLLTRPESADRSTADVLDTADTLFVIGGPAAVSDAVLDEFVFASGVATTRLAGPNRYATALAVTDDLLDRGLVDLSSVWVATGQNWPDATAAGPVIADARDVMILVDGMGSGGDADSHAWLREHADAIDRVTALGGTKAVASDVLREVAISVT